MSRRMTACVFCWLCATVPIPANAAPNFVFGLDPGGAYDVRANGQVVIQGAIPGPAGEVTFDADPSLPISILPAGAPPADTIPPAVVGDLAVTAATQLTATLGWTAVGDDGMTGRATAYEIRRSSAPIDSSSWAAATAVDVPFAPADPGTPEVLVVTGLTAATTYHFAIRAVDEAGNRSPVSPDAAGQTMPAGDTSPPSTPGGLTAATNLDRVDLAWSGSPEPDLAGYLLYRRETGAGAPPPVTIGGIRTISFADSGVQAEVEYAYSIAARDSSGNVSSPSGEVRVRPALQGFLPEVSDFQSEASIDSILAGGRCLARVAWTAQTARRFAGFAVDRSSDAGASWDRRTQAPLAGAGPFVFQEDLAAGSYLYRISAVSPRGYELAFNAMSLSWDGKSLGPAVAGPFPNPSAGSFELRFALAQPTRVRVALYDLSGRLLGLLRDAAEGSGQHPWRWDRSQRAWRSLASGVYLLQVETGGTRLARKIIVRK